MNQSNASPIGVVTKPGRRTTRWILGVAGVAVVGTALAIGLGVGQPATAQAPKVAKTGTSRGNLELFEVTKSDFEITTSATGELRAKDQVEIRNTIESETTITEIVPEGTMVKKGDVLVKLNAESIQTKFDEETLELENARAFVVDANENYEIQVSQNESDKRAAELKLSLAKLELQKWREGEVESKKQDLDHTLDRALKEEKRLQDVLVKSRKLREKDYYSQNSLEQDIIAAEEATAASEKARLAKKIYWEFEHPRDEKQKVSDVDQAQAEVERVIRQNTSRLASKEADKKNKQQAFLIREQKFNKFKEQLDAAVIKAPNDGLVVYSTSLENFRWRSDDGPLKVGSKVQQNQVLMVLPDTSVMLASVKVHETLAGRISKGGKVTVKIDAVSDHAFTGKVDEISIMPESSWPDFSLREHSIKIALDLPADGSGSSLRPSMRCEAEILLGKVADAIAVPIQAVHSEGLLHYVNVADSSGKRFTRRPVQIGQRSDRFAEVRAGVNPGERVLLRKTEPGEILDKTWNNVELAAVGLEVNERGDVVPTAAAIAEKQRLAEAKRPKPSGTAVAGATPGTDAPASPADQAKPAAPAAASADNTPDAGTDAGGADEAGKVEGGGTVFAPGKE